MSITTPAQLILTLAPSPEDILKREDRTLVWRETHPDGTRTVVKLYRKRGWLSTWRSRIFRFRTEREYRRLRHLERWRIPCTNPLGWARGASPEHGRHEALIMREIPGAVQLRDHLQDRLRASDPVDLAPLFQIVRRMHESGFCHQTLYASNVLVAAEAEAGSEFFIADVPRSWTFPHGIVGTRMALYDLLDLVTELEEIGVAHDTIQVEAYGLDTRARRFLGRNRRRDARSKNRRLLRDAQARLRWALAWGLARIRPGRPPSEHISTHPVRSTSNDPRDPEVA